MNSKNETSSKSLSTATNDESVEIYSSPVKSGEEAVSHSSTAVTPVKYEDGTDAVSDDNDGNNYGTKKHSPSPSLKSKHITRNVTKTVKTEDDDQEDKVIHVMENIYETVRTRDADIALKEGLLLPIASDQGEKHYVITKVVNKRSKEDKNKLMNLLIESFFRYCYVGDCPLRGHAAREIFESHVVCLYLKEVEEDQDEPFYTLFGNDPECKLALNPMEEDGVYKFNCACNDCKGQDACDEFMFGPYCVAAVQRYFAENKYHSKVKGAYQVFVAHYNRVLDYHSFDWQKESEGMRHTEITRPPHCMKEGSLKHALFWVKWQIENGPQKEYYDDERRKRKRNRMLREAMKEASKKYRYIEQKK